MYFLWRNNPHAVLGQNDKWIPKGEIQAKIKEILIFRNARSARHMQRTKYNQAGISVLNHKSFKAKTGIKKLPGFKSEEEQPQEMKEDGKRGETRSFIYGEYLEQLCEVDSGQRSRVVIPPSNLEFTANTPIIQDAGKLMKGLLECMDSLEEKERQLLEEIKQLDLMNSDRLHMVEMYELTDAECVAFIHDLHRSQIERRRRKNDLLAITAEKNVLQALDKSGLRQALAAISSLGKQEYHCRVIQETDPIISARRKQRHSQKGGVPHA